MVAVPFAVAHNPASNTDSHRYISPTGDYLIDCGTGSSYEDLFASAGISPPPFHCIGGAIFEIGTDLAGGTQFRVVITDDTSNPVGLYVNLEDADGNRLPLPGNTPTGCGEYPEGGGFGAMPATTAYILVWVDVALSPLDCLASGEIGLPATTGTLTAITA